MHTTQISPRGDARSYNAAGARLEPLTERIDGVLIARTRHALAHAQTDEPIVAVIRHRTVARGSGDWPGVTVSAYGAWDAVERERRPISVEAVPDGEQFDPEATNRIGQRGAYCAVEQPERIAAAVRRAIARLPGVTA